NGYLVKVNFFFFSIRRRHTRFSRDWSSDVCSSDLVQRDTADTRLGRAVAPQVAAHPQLTGVVALGDGRDAFAARALLAAAAERRSEERRVGKECRSRWAPSCASVISK